MREILRDDDYESPFDDVAFVLFRSTQPGYSFADSLNRLYNLGLHRIDDITLDESVCPFYIHHDPMNRLRYFLVEPRGIAGWLPDNKLMIIKGENALRTARFIDTDFATPPKADPVDFLAQQHAELLDELLSDFTVATLIDPENPPQGLSRKAAREYAQLQDHCLSMLDYIEQKHLDLTDEEQRRLTDLQ